MQWLIKIMLKIHIGNILHKINIKIQIKFQTFTEIKGVFNYKIY